MAQFYKTSKMRGRADVAVPLTGQA
jgi:hypothetical protein